MPRSTLGLKTWIPLKAKARCCADAVPAGPVLGRPRRHNWSSNSKGRLVGACTKVTRPVVKMEPVIEPNPVGQSTSTLHQHRVVADDKSIIRTRAPPVSNNCSSAEIGILPPCPLAEKAMMAGA